MADPLAVLLVDEEAIARDELAEILRPYVGITEVGGLILAEQVEVLKASTRILAVLLALRAAQLMGLRSGCGATPTELTDLSGLPAGTVRPKLTELTRRRLVAKDGTRYVVPSASVRLAGAIVRGSNHFGGRRR